MAATHETDDEQARSFWEAPEAGRRARFVATHPNTSFQPHRAAHGTIVTVIGAYTLQYRGHAASSGRRLACRTSSGEIIIAKLDELMPLDRRALH